MREHNPGVIVMEGGSSMFYFTGTSWTATGRTLAPVLPARGAPA